MLKVTISTWKCLFLFFFCAFGDSCLLFAYTCTVVAVCKVIKSSICWLRSCGFFFAFAQWRKQTTGLAADNEYFCTLHHIDSSWYMTVSNEYLFAAYLDCWRLKLLFFSFLLALYSESSQTVRVFHFFFWTSHKSLAFKWEVLHLCVFHLELQVSHHLQPRCFKKAAEWKKQNCPSSEPRFHVALSFTFVLKLQTTREGCMHSPPLFITLCSIETKHRTEWKSRF